jgi:SAM-dependent methyltransferase
MPATRELISDAESGNAAATLEVRLQCPRCRHGLEELACANCGFHMQVRDGIVLALPPERAEHYARFIADYEHIRAAEGRGSKSKDYYLNLPYKDVTGSNHAQWTIRARSYNYMLERVLRQEPGCSAVLDLGAGNCWMSYRLAMEGYCPVAVDLLSNEQDGLGAATYYEQTLMRHLPRFQAELTYLPFQDEQFDAVVFNASFHYSEDYVATLREALRCLRPNGIIIICDTPWYSRDESGRTMVQERQSIFRKRFGTASNSIQSLEYLTDERLRQLEAALGIHWQAHTPWHGLKWAMRPWVARIWRRREPSQFRMYVGRKYA